MHPNCNNKVFDESATLVARENVEVLEQRLSDARKAAKKQRKQKKRERREKRLRERIRSEVFCTYDAIASDRRVPAADRIVAADRLLDWVGKTA